MALAPFRCRPAYHVKPWGSGARLRRLDALSPPEGTGEVWLVSDVEGQPSAIADGPWEGKTLRELVAAEPHALLGPHAAGGRFPMLVKLLDVAGRLSVQVHPDGPTARELKDGERGKSEAWLVLAAGPEGEVGHGFERAPAPDELARLSREGRLPELMRRWRPAEGEWIEVLPGTFHYARDIAFLEVQETSDITYRVWDWGSARELHLRQAAECLRRIPAPRAGGSRQPPESLALRGPFPFGFSVRSLERPWSVEGAFPRVAIALSGAAEVAGSGPRLSLSPGQAAVLPASAPRVELVAASPGTRVAVAAAPPVTVP